jgi:hypothetical protein
MDDLPLQVRAFHHCRRRSPRWCPPRWPPDTTGPESQAPRPHHQHLRAPSAASAPARRSRAGGCGGHSGPARPRQSFPWAHNRAEGRAAGSGRRTRALTRPKTNRSGQPPPPAGQRPARRSNSPPDQGGQTVRPDPGRMGQQDRQPPDRRHGPGLPARRAAPDRQAPRSPQSRKARSRRPVDPKPPSPRVGGVQFLTTSNPACTTGATTACATRSPWRTV